MLSTKVEPFSISHTSVFVHEPLGVQGNPCKVSLFQQPPQNPPETTLPDTQCYSWPLTDNVVAVCCWSGAGKKIQCCGHGLLASAALWMHHTQQATLSLQMNGSKLKCHREDELIWLNFPQLCLSLCDVPDWVGDLFSCLPVFSAIAGGEDGYLILEWPPGYPIEDIVVNASLLAQLTRRALITTSLAVGNKENKKEAASEIVLRYFAPQYGVEEDTATGSAMRVLAEYWQQRSAATDLVAHQRSPLGGVLYSRYSPDGVSVGGAITHHVFNKQNKRQG